MPRTTVGSAASNSAVAEAVALLEQYNGRAQVLAGGTDLLVNMKMERAQAEQVIAASI